MAMKQDMKRKSASLKLIEDKKAIGKCIREGGNLKQLAEQRGFQFAKPL